MPVPRINSLIPTLLSRLTFAIRVDPYPTLYANFRKLFEM